MAPNRAVFCPISWKSSRSGSFQIEDRLVVHEHPADFRAPEWYDRVTKSHGNPWKNDGKLDEKR